MSSHRRAAIVLAALCCLAAGAVPSPASAAHVCDTLLGKSTCLAPFPNDWFTVADKRTATGRRVAIARAAMPANGTGVHIDPAEWNRNDGFSPGITVIARIPGLETQAAFVKSGLVPSTDMGRYANRKQAAVVLDAKTGKRHPIWAELDALAKADADRNLMLRPARNYREGHRYIVALRGLRGANGKLLKAPAGFRVFRDRLASKDKAVNGRRGHMESLFKALKKAGIARKGLYAAWDFTVASERSLSERMLHIRNDAFAQLGDKDLADGKVAGRAPAFAVSKVTDFERCTAPEDQKCAAGTDRELRRQIEGTFEVPCYLDQPGCPPGSGFDLDAKGLPVQTAGNVEQAPFVCNVPWAATDASGTVKLLPALYGHGLFGDIGEARRSRNVHQLGDENRVLVCATDFKGMSDEDVPQAAPALLDLSKFPPIVDRLQQGLLNFTFLGRLLNTPDGFAASDAFKLGGATFVDTSAVTYYGNSQGGILGGALTAISPDVTRSVLYVPGMTYSVLLPRSVDFDDPDPTEADFAGLLYGTAGYPDEATHPLVLDIMQMLWDRGEPSGYAQHMTTDPLPGTPAHHVLMEIAIGDHQVANIQAEVMARTIGARLRVPSYDVGRNLAENPAFGLGILGGLPIDDNAIIPWDIGPLRQQDGKTMGTDPPPPTNVPPTTGQDPHDYVIEQSPAIRRQISEYLRPGGKIVEVCNAMPCRTPDWAGPPADLG
ncbi:MAG: hypothetical protein ACJ762_08970 [Solirubrobacteraceae bacterium]